MTLSVAEPQTFACPAGWLLACGPGCCSWLPTSGLRRPQSNGLGNPQKAGLAKRKSCTLGAISTAPIGSRFSSQLGRRVWCDTSA